MAEEQAQIKSLDTVKIYILFMGGLCILALGWLLYNYVLYSKYDSSLVQGCADLEKIIELEKKLPPKQKQEQKQELVNIYQFFQRTVRGIPQPELEESEWEPGSVGGKTYKEKRYVIRFDHGITRRNLARYIYKICEAAPFLKLKSCELQKLESAKPYEDEWRTEIVFAQRQIREEE